MSKKYNPAGLMYSALNNARKNLRLGLAKRRGKYKPDAYPEAMVKSKPAPTLNNSQSARMGDDIVRMVDESEKESVKKTKKTIPKSGIKTRKNIYEKTRWM